MKITINKEAFDQVSHQIQKKLKSITHFIQSFYQKLSKRQRVALSVIAGLMVFLLILMSFHGESKKVKQPILKPHDVTQFETQPINKPQVNTTRMTSSTKVANDAKLQAQLNEFKNASHAHYVELEKQLQRLQSTLLSLPSQHDVQQLQQAIAQPNDKLIKQVNHLEKRLQAITKQTEKKTWVNPQSVERYFKLVAVQGFSDGMRTIIDVNGNQTTLSEQQICPACRGWVLQQMDFAHQSAIFAKKAGEQVLYVKLQANE